MKKFMLICGPCNSRSGYGDHTRDVMRSFIDNYDGTYDIRIIDVPWGSTPRNALDINVPKDKELLDRYLNQDNDPKKQPDVYVDIRIPNEFQQHGKFNIGVTAGIETDVATGIWIESCNKMDLIIVPSEHSKRGISEAVYDKMQDLPNGEKQKIGELKLEKPIEVLFEGTDVEMYKPLTDKEIKGNIVDVIDNTVTTDFNFLFVGLWGQGGFGEDRKDIGNMIKIFFESFANRKDQPGLIMKTSGAGFGIIEKTQLLAKIKQIKSMFPESVKLPNIYLLHGSLTEPEMNLLYNHPKVNGMINFGHGEGFGRPLLEATMTGLPVIASGWSGQLDFLPNKLSTLVAGEIQQVPKSAVWKNIIEPHHKWFYINPKEAFSNLIDFHKEYEEYKSKAIELMNINREKFSLPAMTSKLDELISDKLNSQPVQVGLNLPKLKPLNEEKELPKLTGVENE